MWEDMAEVYIALGQWGDAVACAKKAVELGPYSPKAYHAQGQDNFNCFAMLVNVE